MQTETFEGLASSTELRRAVQQVGFEIMTPIQARAKVDAGGIEQYAHEVEPLLDEGYISLDMAAALLKMALEGGGQGLYAKSGQHVPEQPCRQTENRPGD